MTTEMLQQHMAKIEAVESAEAALYRAGLAWAPLQRAANEAKGKMVNAQRQVQTAEADYNRIEREISEFNPELGREIGRRHNANNLSRETIGEGGGKLVKDVLSAEKALRKAQDEAKQAVQRSSEAHIKANTLFRDVLQALDALHAHTSGDRFSDVRRVFQEAHKDPDRVADSCKTRLEVLGAK
jgi:hypothetical protein